MDEFCLIKFQEIEEIFAYFQILRGYQLYSV